MQEALSDRASRMVARAVAEGHHIGFGRCPYSRVGHFTVAPTAVSLGQWQCLAAVDDRAHAMALIGQMETLGYTDCDRLRTQIGAVTWVGESEAEADADSDGDKTDTPAGEGFGVLVIHIGHLG